MLKLDAVNQMLGSIGQTPVSSINQNPDVLFAVATLNRVDKKVQGKGWWFNTDKNLTLSYNPVTDEVIVPGNTMGVDPVDTTSHLVQRGTRLYDTNASTFEIGKDVIVNIKLLLDFDNLPENAASYIAAKATYEFHRDKIGDKTKMVTIDADVKETKLDLMKDDIKFSNIRITNNPNVLRVMRRITPSW